MKIILHVGNEKTGTTSLQKFLAEKFSNGNQALYYPTAGRNDVGAHRKLYEDLIDGDCSYLAEDLRGVTAKNVVISTEAFSFANTRANHAFDAFADLAIKNEWEVKLVGVIREAAPFMRALYMEGLNWGWTYDFERFTLRHLTRLYASSLEDMAERHGWESEFIAYQPTKLLSSFATAISPELQIEGDLPRSNTTAPLAVAPILLEANRSFQDIKLTAKIKELVKNYKPKTTGEFDEDKFFKLTHETSEMISKIETTDPIRKRLFGNQDKPD